MNATDLQWELRLPHSRVRSQLVVLTKFGLLAEVSTGSDKKHWYLRQESPFWAMCLDWVEQWRR